MDNGPELVAGALADWAQQHGVELKFIQPGRPMQNGFIERLNRSYRKAVLNMYMLKTLEEVRERTETWIVDYSEVLPHDALGDPTPVEYRVLHHPETSSNGGTDFGMFTHHLENGGYVLSHPSHGTSLALISKNQNIRT